MTGLGLPAQAEPLTHFWAVETEIKADDGDPRSWTWQARCRAPLDTSPSSPLVKQRLWVGKSPRSISTTAFYNSMFLINANTIEKKRKKKNICTFCH